MNILSETLAQSVAGAIAFPEVVRRLVAEGVESYHTDLVRREETFYFPNGETQVDPLPGPETPIAASFSAEGVVEAIRGSQSGAIKYPEFLERIRKAGTTNYVVYLSGRRCIYFGRCGDFHVEHFPS